MSQPTPLPESLRRRIADLVKKNGERATVTHLGIGRQTIARALAGLALLPGTHALIRQGLDERTEVRK